MRDIMFGLTTYEFLMVSAFIVGAVFWAGAVYQQLRDGVQSLKWLKERHIKLEGRVDRIEDHLGLEQEPASKVADCR